MASADPHWPAPVSVVRRLVPSCLVVVGLGNGGVGLVRAGRADALVLVVDVGRRVQRLLQAARAEQRRGTPLRVDLAHRAGNLDLALGADLLQDQAIGKSGARSSGPSGFSVPGCRGGAMGFGRSAAMLYQARGMRLCGRLYWIVSMRNILPCQGNDTLLRRNPTSRFTSHRNERIA